MLFPATVFWRPRKDHRIRSFFPSKAGFIPGSSRISLRWLIYIVNSVDKTKLSSPYSLLAFRFRKNMSTMTLSFAIDRDVVISARQGHIKLCRDSRPYQPVFDNGTNNRLWLLGDKPLLITNKEVL